MNVELEQPEATTAATPPQIATIQKILVPLDGSELAETALPCAEALARALGAELLLIRAAMARVTPGVDPTDAQIKVVADAEAYLARIEDRLRAAGVTTKSVVPYGDATTVIVDDARFHGADLVVMTTHGRSGLNRWMFGSVAEHVLRRSHVPVLLLRPSVPAQPTPGWPHRIVVPLDGSALAEAVLPTVAAMARAVGAPVTLVQALTPVVPVATPTGFPVYVELDETEVMAGAKDYLDQVAARLEQLGVVAATSVQLGEPATEIMAALERNGADLVAMATHGRSGLGRWLFGSVADRVLHQIMVPLLVLRPAGPLGEESA